MRPSHVKEAVLDLSFYRDWISKREKKRKEKKDKPAIFVTISREFGCEGYELASLLQKEISERSKDEWSLFTRSLLEDMVASESMEADMVRKVSEERYSFKDWFVDALVPKYLQSESSKVFEGLRNIILNLVDKGNCIMLGAGSQIITHRLDPSKFLGVHIRIVAGKEWRIERVGDLMKVDREHSEQMLSEHQNLRDRFVTDFTGLESDDPVLYNITFNNGRNDIETMKEIIIRYLELSGAFD